MGRESQVVWAHQRRARGDCCGCGRPAGENKKTGLPFWHCLFCRARKQSWQRMQRRMRQGKAA